MKQTATLIPTARKLNGNVSPTMLIICGKHLLEKVTTRFSTWAVMAKAFTTWRKHSLALQRGMYVFHRQRLQDDN